MSDEELIARLRAYREHDERSGGMASFEVEECIEAADRIEALTEQLTAARQDAKAAEAYAEEVEADRKKTYEALLKVSRIHGEVEAKLAKAVEVLNALDATLDRNGWHFASIAREDIRAAIAEIKGESHE